MRQVLVLLFFEMNSGAHYTTIHLYEGFSFQEIDVTVAEAIYFSPTTESNLGS